MLPASASSSAQCTCRADCDDGQRCCFALLYAPAHTALLPACSCRDAALPLQGNGHERDKLHFQDTDLHILDIYNCDLWPGDKFAQKAIDTEVQLTSGTSDEGASAGRHQRSVMYRPGLSQYDVGTAPKFSTLL